MSALSSNDVIQIVNKARSENRVPDLSGADLSGADQKANASLLIYL